MSLFIGALLLSIGGFLFGYYGEMRYDQEGVNVGVITGIVLTVMGLLAVWGPPVTRWFSAY